MKKYGITFCVIVLMCAFYLHFFYERYQDYIAIRDVPVYRQIGDQQHFAVIPKMTECKMSDNVEVDAKLPDAYRHIRCSALNIEGYISTTDVALQNPNMSLQEIWNYYFKSK